MDHVLAYALEFLVDAVWFYHLVGGSQRVPKGVGQRTDGAVLNESVAGGGAGAPGGVDAPTPAPVSHGQVVEEGGRVEERLEGRVEVASVSDVEHAGTSGSLDPVAHLHAGEGVEHSLGFGDTCPRRSAIGAVAFFTGAWWRLLK